MTATTKPPPAKAKRAKKKAPKKGRPKGSTKPPRILPAQVLALHRRGLNYRQIAEKLGTSPRTVNRWLAIARAEAGPTISLPVTANALPTLLAALRLFQQEFDTPEAAAEAFPDHFADHAPLTDDQIDQLCQMLNP
jgi:transcriptional regulator with XRE-family HTH domain